MKRNRYTEEKITSILKEHEAGASVPDLVASPRRRREHDLPLEVEVWRHGGVGREAGA